MRFPDRWIFVVSGITLAIGTIVVSASPSLRSAITAGWEVRELLRFRVRFRPENVGRTCPTWPLYRIAECARSLIRSEGRLENASMTARIYYLSTVSEAAEAGEEFARTRSEKVENRADLLEYLNDEMKGVLVRAGGKVDLSTLDGQIAPKGDETPEEALERRYYANLVDLWVKNWRKEERYLSANRGLTSLPELGRRLSVLRADRDALYSRLSTDLSRYEKRRVPAEAPDVAVSIPSK